MSNAASRFVVSGYARFVPLTVQLEAHRAARSDRNAGIAMVAVLSLLLGVVIGLTWPGTARAEAALFSDGFETPCAPEFDTDGDGFCDDVDQDDDDDGIPDDIDDCPLDPDDGCGIPLDPCADPLVQPAGLFGIERTWVSFWSAPNGSAVAVFPNSAAGVVPIGANIGTWVTTPATYPLGMNAVVSWDQAQSNNGYGYGRPRVTHAGMFVGFSPCRGDLRPADTTSPLWWLRPACRRFANAGGIILSTTVTTVPTVCWVPPGDTVYMTIAPVNPAVNVLQETCAPPTFVFGMGEGCDVQALHRGTFVP